MVKLPKLRAYIESKGKEAVMVHLALGTDLAMLCNQSRAFLFDPPVGKISPVPVCPKCQDVLCWKVLVERALSRMMEES